MPESVTSCLLKESSNFFWILFQINGRSLIKMFKEQSTETSAFACLTMVPEAIVQKIKEMYCKREERIKPESKGSVAHKI